MDGKSAVSIRLVEPSPAQYFCLKGLAGLATGEQRGVRVRVASIRCLVLVTCALGCPTGYLLKGGDPPSQPGEGAARTAGDHAAVFVVGNHQALARGIDLWSSRKPTAPAAAGRSLALAGLRALRATIRRSASLTALYRVRC